MSLSRRLRLMISFGRFRATGNKAITK